MLAGWLDGTNFHWFLRRCSSKLRHLDHLHDGSLVLGHLQSIWISLGVVSHALHTQLAAAEAHDEPADQVRLVGRVRVSSVVQ